jgi:hypothetical protein
MKVLSSRERPDEVVEVAIEGVEGNVVANEVARVTEESDLKRPSIESDTRANPPRRNREPRVGKMKKPSLCCQNHKRR